MRKIITLIISIALIINMTSCDLLEGVSDDNLSKEEIIKGLKTALNLGTDTASTTLNHKDGYYKDELVKILLPPEGKAMYDAVNTLETVLGSGYIENTVKRINRAAEKAAVKAKPIFKDAITNMSITDAMTILQGQNPSNPTRGFDSTAATGYLKSTTYTKLVEAYSPEIDHTLDEKLVGNVSANQAWQEGTKYYNSYLSMPGDEIEVPLGQYTTQKALDGLFFKIGNEEKKIRKDPFKWSLDILNKVFGAVYKKN